MGAEIPEHCYEIAIRLINQGRQEEQERKLLSPQRVSAHVEEPIKEVRDLRNLGKQRSRAWSTDEIRKQLRGEA